MIEICACSGPVGAYFVHIAQTVIYIVIECERNLKVYEKDLTNMVYQRMFSTKCHVQPLFIIARLHYYDPRERLRAILDFPYDGQRFH